MTTVAFFGTPEEAVPILDALHRVADVALVITRRDRPRGRSGRPLPPPVKAFAEEAGLPVAQPGPLGDLVPTLEEVDVAVLAAYGRLIPAEVLSAPRRGFVNVHYSLLPRWRGASPVVRAILAGDAETGVTLMEMDEGFDTGRIITSRATPIGPEETGGELTMRLAVLGGELLAECLDEWVDGDLTATAQDEAGVTAAAKVTMDEAFVLPGRHGVDAVTRAIRAFEPRPGAWGVVDGERIKRRRAAPAPGRSAEPGVAAVVGGQVLLGCADGTVELLRVQPAGSAVMDAAAWMNGRRGAPARFTAP
jgi:methionyl-tRNA formyltransferase